MSKNGKKSERDSQLDEFWDISALMPRRQPHRVRRAEATDAVDVVLDAPPQSSDAVPCSVLTDTSLRLGEQRAVEGRGGMSRTADTAREQPPEPSDDYVPEHSLINRVRVFEKNNKYSYYEQFADHAARVGGLRGRQCPRESFFSYVPQFSQLTKPQLDWYLWWRECLWEGRRIDTDFSYILLYIYEIINTAGHGNPQWGQRQLCLVWRSYRTEYPRLDRLLGDWICDFSLIHHLPPPLKHLSGVLEDALPSCSLREFYMSLESDRDGDRHIGKMLITFCSNYNYTSSKFCVGDNAALYAAHIPQAVDRLADKLLICRDGRISSGGRIESCSSVRDAFSGGLCTNPIRLRLEVTYSSFARSYELRFIISDSVKYAENKLRAYLGVKSRLTTHALTPEAKRCIDEYFEQHLPRDREAEPPEYEKLYDAPVTSLSPENAAEIEQSSWETTERLIDAFGAEQTEQAVEVPERLWNSELSEADLQVTPPTCTSDGGDLCSALDGYMEFIGLLDRGETVAARTMASERGEMIELMVDSINEIAINILGDVILEDTENGYAVIPEYRKELFND